mmetsp:Transcript_6114/g.37903  ORF Transcript_6114/g.37903 Transcript_6114/m.37903 type:complete len:107 (-) Transcript_6114:2533-2853(-)
MQHWKRGRKLPRGISSYSKGEGKLSLRTCFKGRQLPLPQHPKRKLFLCKLLKVARSLLALDIPASVPVKVKKQIMKLGQCRPMTNTDPCYALFAKELIKPFLVFLR